jgi:uncharacterized membrane protein YbhN (UPF0104 family)
VSPTWRGPATKRPLTKLLRALVSVGFTVVLLAVVIRSVDMDRVISLIRNARWGWLAIAMALVPLQVCLGALRWQRVATDLNLSLSRRRAVNEYGLSVLLNQILPGGIAGDAVRVWRHKRGHGALGAPLRAAVVERAIGHVAHLVVTLVGVLLWSNIHGDSAPAGSLPLVMCMCLFFVLLWWFPVRGFRSLIQYAHVALGSVGQWLFHTVISVILVGSFLLSFWCCAQALQLPLGLGAVTAVPLLMLIMIIPFSVGGWGLREISATAVLATLGWSPESALALSAAYGVANLLGAAPGALVFLNDSPKEVAA